MLIDWFTVTAQALNFLILVWLLRRFAYQPVLQAISRREERIAAQLAAAASAEAAANTEREALSGRRLEFEQHRAALLDQATQEAAALRSKLLEQARQDGAAERSRLLAVLRAEQVELELTLAREVRQVVLEIVGKTLQDLAHVELNDAMVEVFLGHLQALGEAERLLLLTAATSANTPVVRSAFELAPDTRARIRTALAALGASDPDVHFETAVGLVCGIDFTAAGHRLAWSVGDYLAGLEEGIDRILEARCRTVPAEPASVPAAIT